MYDTNIGNEVTCMTHICTKRRVCQENKILIVYGRLEIVYGRSWKPRRMWCVTPYTISLRKQKIFNF